ILFLVLALSGFGLLFLTVSRVSFFVLTFSLVLLLILQKKKWVILFLLGATLIFLFFSPRLLQRFGNTVSEVDVLVDANTGAAISQVREVPQYYFKDKTVLREGATADEAKTNPLTSIYPYKLIPNPAEILVQANVPTGETLPQGTGYINLTLSPIIKKVPNYFTEKTIEKNGSSSAEIRAFEGGRYLVKKAKAYDLSFTTRFQGEWPRTIESFRRNIFIGSGYGSVSLAVDNDYLRLLGETGLFGFFSFALIFITAGIYIRRAYPKIESPVFKSFVLGFVLGTLGLFLNGTLIDVFEASKVAFTYWILMGLTLGVLKHYSEEEIDILRELRKIMFSPISIVIFILLLIVALYSPMISNYFVGDDFTWLRWSAQAPHNLLEFFTNSSGFFYRPGAKLYFYVMYKLFWLNPTVYHTVSLGLHFLTAVLLFTVLRKILKNYALSVISVFLFLVLSSYHEVIFWISSTGFIFASIFTLLSILSYIYWVEKRKRIYIIITLFSAFISPLFHELGVVTPFLIIAYDFVFVQRSQKLIKNIYFALLSPLIPYAILRLTSGSHWFSGDYSYNIVKLPFNFVGNALGYFVLELTGPQSLEFYDKLRSSLRGSAAISLVGIVLVVFLVLWLKKRILAKLDENEKRIVIFGGLFFIISLLPFLGLGNIASRYSYLSSMGIVLPLSILVKRTVGFLKTLGDKYTTTMVIILTSLVFLSFQLFQIQMLHQDWRVAGEKSKNFLISFQGIYKDEWKNGHMDFYFVNTPIRNGQAWIFPVGLPDALWFTFPDQNVSVHNVENVDDSFFKTINPKNSEVLKFNEYGRVEEIFQGQK
ncbi:MAG TPA: hypothetical protein VFA93_02730, partial [Patescibacteria group bacterium]|nr:hypothetical protein [Patescibacteria group bacterium]